MEAYQVKTSDNRYYLVVAPNWDIAAKVAEHGDCLATEITRLTGDEASFPTLLIDRSLWDTNPLIHQT